MILCIDIGNTNVVFALVEGDQIISKRRIKTRTDITSDELEMILEFFFKKNKDISDIVVSSVVPPLNSIIREACLSCFEKEPIVINPKMEFGISILYEEVEKLGLDRIINAAGAFNKYKKGVIIIDFGTATTFDYVSSDGRYMGGAISPGIRISADALFKKAYQLPKIENFWIPKRVLAKGTLESINAGVIFGYSSLVDGMVNRIKQETEDKNLITVATGGLCFLMKDICRNIDEVDEDLTIYGLAVVYRLNKR